MPKESARATLNSNLRYLSFYEVVPVKHIGNFIQTSWLDVYSNHVISKLANE